MKENMYRTSLMREFTALCLTNEYNEPFEGSVEYVHQCWDKANNFEEFRTMILEDERFVLSQGYAELSKETNEHWRRVRAMFGEKCFKTCSDAGAVKIKAMNGDFSILFGNGIGDGITRCAVFEGEEECGFNTNMMNYTGIVLNGRMSIMDYDCGNTPIKELDGKYLVYVYEGLVAFVKRAY